MADKSKITKKDRKSNSPGQSDRVRPVSDVIGEDGKSGPQARLRRRRRYRH
jgi:hypothetical protein